MSHGYDHRFAEYQLSTQGYAERSAKSLAAAAQQQQQAAVAATAASQHNRNVLGAAAAAAAAAASQPPLHLVAGSGPGHRQLMSSAPGQRQHNLAHHPFGLNDNESAPKRPRLIVEQKPSLHQPLHIDIRDSHDVGSKKVTGAPPLLPLSRVHVSAQPAYTPQVEAISPTLPNDENRQDLSPFKITKDELVQNINRIDREISEAELQIAKLRKKQVIRRFCRCRS